MNNIKWRDAVRILKKNGYYYSYTRGDHAYFFDAKKQRITLPFHVKRGNECPYGIWIKEVKRKNLTI